MAPRTKRSASGKASVNDETGASYATFIALAAAVLTAARSLP